jgi:hypothetical protein
MMGAIDSGRALFPSRNSRQHIDREPAEHTQRNKGEALVSGNNEARLA